MRREVVLSSYSSMRFRRGRWWPSPRTDIRMSKLQQKISGSWPIHGGASRSLATVPTSRLPANTASNHSTSRTNSPPGDHGSPTPPQLEAPQPRPHGARSWGGAGLLRRIRGWWSFVPRWSAASRCGRCEGFDEDILDHSASDRASIGRYVPAGAAGVVGAVGASGAAGAALGPPRGDPALAASAVAAARLTVLRPARGGGSGATRYHKPPRPLGAIPESVSPQCRCCRQPEHEQ